MEVAHHISKNKAYGPPVHNGKLKGLAFSHAFLAICVGLNAATA
jgi:hypothetical protein